MTKPKKIDLFIPTQYECLSSHASIKYVSSDRTFCAGNLNGFGPCKGDSGGGLAVKINERWVLRGIVSVSIRNEDGCDLNYYTIFILMLQNMKIGLINF